MTVLPEVEAEMRRLVLRDGWKVETTARRFGMHHTVVRRVRSTDALEPKPAAKSILDPFKPYLVERLTEYPELTATRPHRAQGTRLRGWSSRPPPLREQDPRGPRTQGLTPRRDRARRAGAARLGGFGLLRVGSSMRPLSCFAMVLSCSRAIFVDFSLDATAHAAIRRPPGARASVRTARLTRRGPSRAARTAASTRVARGAVADPRASAARGHTGAACQRPLRARGDTAAERRGHPRAGPLR
ncbi:MAG: hypothetical protein ACK6CU_19625, partial [Deltaproteobacteria bacterium]